MSRRRGEFEHRTSIFEGAFRAWSHLGGISPIELETKTAKELDPLDFPIVDDPRLTAERAKMKGKKQPISGDEGSGGGGMNNGGKNKVPRKEFAYEPLPRSGLAHPFVQAILSPWLGPDADQDAIQLGLTTLRTWWQHRRKGESGSAIVALGTEKMQGVVEGYTRHFFNLAHCLIVNDHEQPPRSLQGKIKDMEKDRNRKKSGATSGTKRSREEDTIEAAAMAFQGGYPVQQQQMQMPQGGGNNMMQQQMGGMNNNNNNDNLSPLERLQAAQNRQLAAAGGVHTSMGGMSADPVSTTTTQPIEMKGRCVPGKVDLPGLVQQVSSAATQLAYRGTSKSNTAPGGISTTTQLNNIDPAKYGDPNITPIVVVSPNQSTGTNDIQLCMTIDGITCAHCVKIVETVLKGCSGTRSPIVGLLDAAADMELNIVLIKIDNINDCRRIAHEAARNLSMVGYTAKAKSVNVPSDMTLQNMYSVMEGSIPNVAPMTGFQWNNDCGCPDNNVLRQDCSRHSQMGEGIIKIFDKTELLLSGFIAGCNQRTGIPCTAGQYCFCKSVVDTVAADEQQQAQPHTTESMFQEPGQQDVNNGYVSYQQPIQDSSPMNGEGEGMNAGRRGRSSMRMSIGRMSIGGLGGLGRHFSMTSETTFGRAMSGLSALSIDWENMDDFDVNVDHSAGINNDIINRQQQQAQQQDDEGGDGSLNSSDGPQQESNGADEYGQLDAGGGRRGPKVARRSSMRKNIPMLQKQKGSASSFNVSFNM